MKVSVSFDSSKINTDLKIASKDVGIIVKQCLRDACILIKRTAKEEHKFESKSGKLERAIKFRVLKDMMTGSVYIDEDIAPYGVFVHEPTGIYKEGGSRYPIKARNAKFLEFKFGDKTIYRQKVMHPGSPADPFIDNAFEINKSIIDKILIKGLKKLNRKGR